MLCIAITLSKCSKSGDAIIPSPIANFSFAAVGSNSNAPSTINFTNSSTNAGSYFWNFGDGITSIDNNPSHKYSSAGVYTVALTASAATKNNTKSQTINILPAFTMVKITKLSLSSTTETNSFTGYFRIKDANNTNLYQTVNFTLNPATLPSTWLLSSPYTFFNLSGTYYVELWKVGTFSNTRVAIGPFLPDLYNTGNSALSSYPTSVTSTDGLSFTLQWEL